MNTNISQLKDFLREYKKEIKEKNLNKVYYRLAHDNNYNLGFENVPDLTLFFIDHGVNPLEYFKNTIPEAFALRLNVYKELKIPEEIKRIHYNAFDSSGITSLYIPSSVKEIEYKAFANCNNLKSVYIDSLPKTLWYSSFEECSNLEKVVFNCTKDEFEYRFIDPPEKFFDGCPKVKIMFKK